MKGSMKDSISPPLAPAKDHTSVARIGGSMGTDGPSREDAGKGVFGQEALSY